MLGEKRNGFKKQIPTLIKDGNEAKSDKEKADMLMQHYTDISNSLPSTNGYYSHYNHFKSIRHQNNNTTEFKGIHHELFTLDQVIDAIKKLKPNAAPGIDEIHNKY